MKTFLLVFTLCCLLCSTLCALSAPNITFPMYDTNLGQQVRRRFTFHIPTIYTNTSTPLSQLTYVPMVLGLHGGFGNSIQYSTSNGFKAVAEQYNFIGIFPDGMSTVLGTEVRCWNVGSIPCQGENSNLFLKLLISTLVEYCNGNKTNVLEQFPEFQILNIQDSVRIDTNRIYQTGHSNGAFATYFAAGYNSQVYAAIAPVSAQIGGYRVQGAPLSIAPTPSSAVNVIHFHGIYDMNVLVNGGETVEGTSNRVDLSLNDTISFWIRNNNCGNRYTFDAPYGIVQSTNQQVKLTQYTNNCANNTNVYSVLYAATHSWGNMTAVIQQANYPYNATSLAEAVWFALARHTKQVPIAPSPRPSSKPPTPSSSGIASKPVLFIYIFNLLQLVWLLIAIFK